MSDRRAASRRPRPVGAPPVNRKLIEVALPLDAINAASAREKSIRHGRPSTLHPWWARRPLAAALAVIFVQMVDDPSVYTDVLLAHPPTKLAAEREWKKRLAAFLANRAEAGDEAAGADRLTHPPPPLRDGPWSGFMTTSWSSRPGTPLTRAQEDIDR